MRNFGIFSPSLLGDVLFYLLVIGDRISLRGTSRPVSDSGPLHVATFANKYFRKTRA